MACPRGPLERIVGRQRDHAAPPNQTGATPRWNGHRDGASNSNRDSPALCRSEKRRTGTSNGLLWLSRTHSKHEHLQPATNQVNSATSAFPANGHLLPDRQLVGEVEMLLGVRPPDVRKVSIIAGLRTRVQLIAQRRVKRPRAERTTGSTIACPHGPLERIVGEQHPHEFMRLSRVAR